MNLEALFGLLQGQDLGKLTEQIGGSNTQVKDGVAAALPAILAAVNKNANNSEKAEGLNNALNQHDGSILNNLGSYLQNPDLKDGAGILGHLFGNNTQNVANAVSQSSGLDSQGSMSGGRLDVQCLCECAGPARPAARRTSILRSFLPCM